MKLFQVVSKYVLNTYVLADDLVTAYDKFISFVDDYISQQSAKIGDAEEPKKLLMDIIQIAPVDMICNPSYLPNLDYVCTNLWEVKVSDNKELRIGLDIKDIISKDVIEVSIFTESCLIIK